MKLKNAFQTIPYGQAKLRGGSSFGWPSCSAGIVNKSLQFHKACQRHSQSSAIEIGNSLWLHLGQIPRVGKAQKMNVLTDDQWCLAGIDARSLLAYKECERRSNNTTFNSNYGIRQGSLLRPCFLQSRSKIVNRIRHAHTRQRQT